VCLVLLLPNVMAQSGIGDIATLILRTSTSGRACGSSTDVLCDGGFDRTMTSANAATNVSLHQQPSPAVAGVHQETLTATDSVILTPGHSTISKYPC